MQHHSHCECHWCTSVVNKSGTALPKRHLKLFSLAIAALSANSGWSGCNCARSAEAFPGLAGRVKSGSQDLSLLMSHERPVRLQRSGRDTENVQGRVDAPQHVNGVGSLPPMLPQRTAAHDPARCVMSKYLTALL